MTALILTLLMPPPLNDVVTLIWISAAILLPFKRVLLLLFSTTLLAPTVLNLALLPGVALGLLIMGRIRSHPGIALFISNSLAYASILIASNLYPSILGIFPSVILPQDAVANATTLALGFVGLVFISALLTAKAQLAFIRAVQCRITYAALH